MNTWFLEFSFAPLLFLLPYQPQPFSHQAKNFIKANVNTALMSLSMSGIASFTVDSTRTPLCILHALRSAVVVFNVSITNLIRSLAIFFTRAGVFRQRHRNSASLGQRGPYSTADILLPLSSPLETVLPFNNNLLIITSTHIR